MLPTRRFTDNHFENRCIARENRHKKVRGYDTKILIVTVPKFECVARRRKRNLKRAIIPEIHGIYTRERVIQGLEELHA
jgi:hypothetical protein